MPKVSDRFRINADKIHILATTGPERRQEYWKRASDFYAQVENWNIYQLSDKQKVWLSRLERELSDEDVDY